MALRSKAVTIDDGFVFSPGASTLYEYIDKSGNDQRGKPLIIGHSSGLKFDIIKWGSNNRLPYENLNLITGNDIKPALIENKTNFIIGKGLIYGYDRVEDGKHYFEAAQDDKIDEWLERNNIQEELFGLSDDLEIHGNAFVDCILSADGTKLMIARKLDATMSRIGIEQDSNLESLVYADWLEKERPDYSEVIPLYSPFLLPLPTRFVMHLRSIQSGQHYYALPVWNGTRDWSGIANIIPRFHEAGLKNGYFIRYHVKIPETYFDKFPAEQREKKKEELRVQMDAFLSGTDNAHKTFYSFLKKLPDGTVVEDWEIKKIDVDLKDDSYLKLHDHSSKVHARGHNIHPILAGVETSGALSSGSEIMNLVNFHVQYKVHKARTLLLKPIKLAQRINKWHPKIIFKFQDVTLTTTDKNPKGQEATVS